MGNNERVTQFCPCGLPMVLIGPCFYCPKHGKNGEGYKKPRERIGKYSGHSDMFKGGYEKEKV